jgi:hypothetical protein
MESPRLSLGLWGESGPATQSLGELIVKRIVKRIAGAMMVLCSVALLPAQASAQVTSADEWQFRATLYGYFPSLGGSSKFPSDGTDIDVSADKIISNLKFVFMGALEAQKGSFGAFTDVIYLNIGGSKAATRDLAIGGERLPAGITANASLDIQGWLWTLAVDYRALSTPQASFDTFAGARLLSLKEELRWAFSGNVGPFVGPERQGFSEESLDNWDGVVGVKGRLNFGAQRAWFVPYYLDIGTGESHFTWQGIAGIGYAFGWGEVIAAWRYIGYDFKSDSTIESLNLNGPAVGVAFRW